MIAAAARFRSRTGAGLSLALFSLLASLPAAAQSAASPDVQHLQQQLVTLTAQADRTGFLVTAVLLLFMAAACLGLWWNARSFRAFGSVGLYLAALCAVFFVDFLHGRNADRPLLILTSLLMPEMTADALGIRKGWWIWLNRVACAVALPLVWTSLLLLASRVTVDLSQFLTLVLLLTGFRRGDARTRLIAAALAFLWFFRNALDPFIGRYLPIGFRIGGWQWDFGPIAMVLFGAVAISIFVRQLIESQREKERLAGELEAGRAMQQVLLGAEIPSIPGLRIQSAYHPASEVGGDFFQVLPAAGGGLLIAIGDVSGKGLRAAMTVSTILGALRALPPAPPAAFLRSLNRSLVGSLQGGFVTCCLAHIAPSGTLTVANAGHLPPYRNGEEVPLESGLPLGLTADAEYSESTLTLAPNDTLTFLSDGVVEARNSHGELFGFDRTRAISTQTAEAIARAAGNHGQEDDITVLTLAYVGAEVLQAQTG